MTTQAAERLYLAQHLYEHEGKGWAIFNPHGKPVQELPAIYGFNNGGSPGWYSAVAIAEDGACLGGHLCSAEGYMPHDLGILEGTRLDRHEDAYQKHYPDGYRMVWVSSEELKGHSGIDEACRLNQLAAEKQKAADASPEKP